MRDKFIALTKKQKIVLLSLSFLLIAVLITIAGIYDSLNLFPRAKSSVTPISIQEPTVLQKTAVTVDQQITNSVSSVKIEGAKPKTKALVYLQKPLTKIQVTATDAQMRISQRKTFIDDLKTKTADIQDQVRKNIKGAIDAKNVIIKKSFYVDNVLLVELDEDGLNKLKQTSGILKITPDSQIMLDPIIKAAANPEWNLQKINADRVWSELGITGKGIVVANIDTGVQWDHPALKNNYRGFNGTTVDHNYNWFDPTNTSPNIPLDNVGHGTHTIGTIVGSDNSTIIGVAPGAKWITAKACGTIGCYQSDLLAAGQWLLEPTRIDGSNPDLSKAPNIINNSWGGPACDSWYAGMVDTWTKAGIFSVFAAGNSGPNFGTIRAPGDHPQAFDVGATDNTDNIASFSSRGPACSTYGSITKPDISAPGVAIRSSIPGNSYDYYSGTSMAAPHIAGVAALLFQSKPNLTPAEITNILKQSATDLGQAGKDNTFGAGLVDAYRALTTVPSPTVFPTTTPPSPISQIQVIQPNGKEQLLPGQTYSIKWTSQNVDQVMIDLIDGNGDFSTQSTPLPASQSEYLWTVPKSWYGTSHAYKIKIYEYPSKVAFDMSDDYFYILFQTPTSSPTITPTPTPNQSIRVTAPNTAEHLVEGQTYQITWNSSNVSSISGIRLYGYDNSNYYVGMHTIISDISNNGSYQWNVSSYGGFSGRATKYKIEIMNAFVRDESDDFFFITTPTTPTPSPTPFPTLTPTPTLIPTPTPITRYIQITDPNGGETLYVGQTYKITWSSSSNIDKVMLGYKWCDSCLEWITSGSIPNTGYYDWTVNVGSLATTQFKIDIIGYPTGVGNRDASDNYFTVLPKPTPSPTPTLMPTPTPANLASVRINPEQIISPLGGKEVYLSTLAFDTKGIPIWYGVRYQWGISSTNSIGKLFPNASNDKIVTFKPSATNQGHGDVWVHATNSNGQTASTSIPIIVGTLSPTPTPCLPADINRDGVVDQKDVQILRTDYWSPNPSNIRSDINHDGIVDLTDYSLLVIDFGKSTGVCQ